MIKYLLILFMFVLFSISVFAAEKQVSILDNRFEPATIEITLGDTLIWTHNGQNPHTVKANDGSFDSGIGSMLNAGNSFRHQFNQDGTVSYFCEVHGQSMSGNIIVQAAQPPAPPNSPPAPSAPAPASPPSSPPQPPAASESSESSPPAEPSIGEQIGQIFQEAIDRIRGAISADSGDISVDTFLALSGPTKKVRGISIVKSGDKMILAKRENGAIDRAAISTIKYQHIDIDVCQKIEQNLAADERELVTCKKDADTGSNFVKIAASNTKLWHQLVSLIQLR